MLHVGSSLLETVKWAADLSVSGAAAFWLKVLSQPIEESLRQAKLVFSQHATEQV